MIDHTHDPAAKSWVAGANDHPDFPLQNLPLGVFTPPELSPRIGTAIGDQCLDLAATAAAGWLGKLSDELYHALSQPTLNALFALDPAYRVQLRHAIFALLTDASWQKPASYHLAPATQCRMHLPFHIGDYTDFYVGIHHATNIGRLFRPDAPLLPNYKHVPIGYHGRASSVRVSGAPVVRPRGQIKPPEADAPIFAPCAKLDYELELGLWVAGANALGEPVPMAGAWGRIGGLCLLNDWSARDMQAWEYQPLGPFLAKNFATTVSPWVITAEALAPFRIAPTSRPAGDPTPLPYLTDATDAQTGALAIEISAHITSAAMRAAGLAPHRLAQGDAARAMYWTPAQMIAHHTSNGCNLNPGDLLGTGTLSGPTPGSEGSMMEISRGGAAPITLPTGEQRCFLDDGDALTLSARAVRAGWRSIGFGACTGIVAPAR